MHYKRTGRCQFGKDCRYRHEDGDRGGDKGKRRVKDEPRRIGLYERMVEQEVDKAERLALEAIKYLGRNGFLG